ncbi:hypothetical protein ACFY8W_36275 [Streptomyces sp. NPDC012637]|uniref:hypothetical protein n=1 Tax=Streptomyces sp. NPDC012637 TaxID=3364842 RepID=UPI0036E081A6
MHTHTRGGPLAALVASALALATACTAGPSGEETKNTAPSTQQSAASSLPTPPPAVATAPMPAGQRQAAMLSQADLPAEWHKRAPGAGRSALPVSDPVCQPLVSLLEDMLWGPEASVGAWFQHGRGEARISTRVTAYTGTGARDHVIRITGAVDGCPAFTTSLRGTKVNVSTSRLPTPAFGAGSETFRLSAGRQGGPLFLQADVIALHRGAAVLSFQYTPSDPSGHERFEPLAKLAANKFIQATHS